ncbi:MAG: tetratricopeptide repeat protein [Planctomycetes bacterium]|nr:tetratricopeptide repeat protein [Planctomycetota bacterium]
MRHRGAQDGLWYAVCFALTLACAVPAEASQTADEALSVERQRAILREALNTFDQAVELSQNEPDRAEQLYRRAAASFETLIERGVSNAGIHYNLGNAYFRLGQPGRAIVCYRRALRFAPRSPELVANLSYARERVRPRINPTGQSRLLHNLLFWQYVTSVRERCWLAAVLGGLGWLVLLVRLRWRARAWVVLGVLLVALGLANSGAALWQLSDESRRPPAVTVAGEHTLRLGRGEGYEPALTEPLGPGVELRIVSERGEWCEVLLPNGQTGWLPTAAVERI